MIDPLPRRPQGDTAEARFMQASWDKMISARIQSSSGAKINRTTRGFKVEVQSSIGAVVSVRMLKLRFIDDDYLICRSWDGTTIGDSDIYVAKQVQHRTVAGTQENFYGKNAIGTAVRLDHVYTFAADSFEPFLVFEDAGGGLTEFGEVASDFSSGGELYQAKMNKTRTVTVDVPESSGGAGDGATYTEEQRIIPVWRRSEVVHAISARTGVTVGGAPVNYLHVCEARQWARIN